MRDMQPLREQVYQRRPILDRLQTATVRLADAQLERIWAIVSAPEQGLSVRQIATTTGLSPTRVHQLLNAPDAQHIPRWRSQLREQDESAAAPAELTPLPADSSRAPWIDVRAKSGMHCALKQAYYPCRPIGQ
ncbi:MAG TPA: hypothetical protein VKY74_02320 [Chloroflexia bacterium]|nr:hypothetical protein [Chloroflexia bacterium]